MSKRTDKVINRINASLSEKIDKWEEKVAEYQEYQDTFGGYRYVDQIADYSSDVKILKDYREALLTVGKQQNQIDQLEKRIRELKALMYKAADKMVGYGEFEVMIRLLNQEINR